VITMTRQNRCRFTSHFLYPLFDRVHCKVEYGSCLRLLSPKSTRHRAGLALSEKYVDNVNEQT
jgi:hypothetical protein